jgi:hypothetical protein
MEADPSPCSTVAVRTHCTKAGNMTRSAQERSSPFGRSELGIHFSTVARGILGGSSCQAPHRALLGQVELRAEVGVGEDTVDMVPDLDKVCLVVK